MRNLLLGAAALGCLVASPALAQQTDINVTASVADACDITNATDIAFGDIGPTESAEQSSTVTLTCTAGTVATITSDTADGEKELTNGDDTLTYTLYKQAGGGAPFTQTDGIEVTAGSDGIGTGTFYAVIADAAGNPRAAMAELDGTVTISVGF